MVDIVLPSEMLLVGCSSSDLFSTLVIDPRTGTSSWSHKGNELQGGCIGRTLPLGRDGEHVVISMKDRPFFHFIGLNSHERYHQRTTVAGPICDFTSNSDGSLLFASIDKRIFVWLMSTGELLSVRESHLQDIKCLSLSEDDSLLVSASEDGIVKVHVVSDLLSDSSESFREWRAHSLSVRGLSLSSGSVRVASCSIDHTASIHSVALDLCLLRISCDRPLTSIVLCPSESRLVLGSDIGIVVCLSLHHCARKDQKEVLLSTTNPSAGDFLLKANHKTEISRLAFSSDGAVVSSGDVEGKYTIWQLSTRQVLKEGSLNGPISSLSFLPSWTSLSNRPNKSIVRPKGELQRMMSERKEIELLKKGERDTQREWMEILEESMERKEVNEEENGDEDEIVQIFPPSHDSKFIKKLQAENTRLKKVNTELYAFASKELLNKNA